MKKVGGVQELQAATDEVQGYCDQHPSQKANLIITDREDYGLFKSNDIIINFLESLICRSNIKHRLKSQVEEKAGTTFSVYESKSYRHQVVAGMNYFVKVHVGNGDYIHLRIYRKLDNTIELTDLKLDQKEHNELCYF